VSSGLRGADDITARADSVSHAQPAQGFGFSKKSGSRFALMAGETLAVPVFSSNLPAAYRIKE
jgi:hypothetical protein